MFFVDTDLSAIICYWLARPFQGRGVMTAAVRSVCDLSFNQYHRQCLRIRPAVDTQASAAVAQRAGFGFLIQHSGGQHLLDGDHDENVYQVSAVDWLAKRHK